MAQHDQNVANDTGAAVRADINAALAALFSNSSGASAPATTVAYMWWADTSAGRMKQRNAANSGWIDHGLLADAFGIFSDVAFVAGDTATSPVGAVNASHSLRGTASTQWVTSFINSHASAPNGIAIKYTSVDPNDTAHEFLYCDANGTKRFAIDSNGGKEGFPGNDVSLSDAAMKVLTGRAGGKGWAHVLELREAIRRGRYTHDAPDRQHTFPVAQDVAKLYPECVQPMPGFAPAELGREALGVREQLLTWELFAELIDEVQRLRSAAGK